MKIFEEGKKLKSWVLKMSEDSDEVELFAVDATTGSHIAYLVSFYREGRVKRVCGAFDQIQQEGYDPHEHGNTWDEDGRIIIE